MKAMILAAGRGERMKPLTDACPKPLLKVAGIPLIEHHINKLKLAGIIDIVINHAWLGEQIESYFGNGDNWGVNIQYSPEYDGALETAGGIINALPLLGMNEFLIVNGDIYCDMPFTHLPKLNHGQLAHLFLVDNPEHNLNGDFFIDGSLLSVELAADNNSTDSHKFTYSGIGIYHPELFLGLAVEKAPLAPILKQAMQQHKINGSIYQGLWSDIGTPQRLEQINQLVS